MIVAVLLASAATDPALLAGRALYQDGLGTPRPAMFLNGSVVAARGRVLPCSGCHGVDGTPPNESRAAPTVQQLAKSARDPALFRSALENGRGADGRMLQLMPRYQLTALQRDELAHYVTGLATGETSEQGVDENSIVVGLSGLSDLQQDGVRKRLSGRNFYGRAIRFGRDGFISIRVAGKGPSVVNVAQLDDVGPAFARAGRTLTRAGFFAALDAIQRERQ